MAKADLTPQRLRELLSYNPDTGEFVCKVARANNKLRPGMVVGSKCGRELMVCVDCEPYRSHRLAWLYMTGRWPVGHIDHIDGDPTNNRWNNLRDVPAQTNWQNRRRPQANNTSGLLGVCWDKSRGKWVAGIYLGGKRVNLGRFDDKESAHRAYMAARRLHYAGNTL